MEERSVYTGCWEWEVTSPGMVGGLLSGNRVGEREEWAVPHLRTVHPPYLWVPHPQTQPTVH